jgi:hypothetical protein
VRSLVVAVVLCLAAAQSMSAQDWEPRPRRYDGVHIRIARDYHLPADRIATSPVVVIGGSATIDGTLEDDLVVIGGRVRLGPTAQVRGKIAAIGGEVDIADSATVNGEIENVGIYWPDIEFASDWLWQLDRGWWALFALAANVFRFTLIMLTACLMALIAPGWIRRIGERASATPIAAGFMGLLAEIMVIPAFLLLTAALVITIVGIPLIILLPFAFLAFLILWLAGFASVAAVVGSRLRPRISVGDGGSPVADVAWGVIVLFALMFVGNLLAFAPPFFWPLSTSMHVIAIGLEFIVWTVGLGAALLAPLQRGWSITPPPVPSTASANA